MLNNLSRGVRSLGHTCTGLGAYMMGLQGRCTKTGRRADCEGGPNLDEARRDYRGMLRVWNSPSQWQSGGY